MHSGKLVAAVVNSRGNLSKRSGFAYSGEGRERTITVAGTLQGERPRSVSVVLKNAITTNKVWQTQPDQQLMYHGVRVWARRHTPEFMLGVYSPEEFDDAVAAVANGVCVHHPDDYSDGVPEKLTKLPEPQTFSRRHQAEIAKMHVGHELHEWAPRIPAGQRLFRSDITRHKIYKRIQGDWLSGTERKDRRSGRARGRRRAPGEARRFCRRHGRRDRRLNLGTRRRTAARRACRN